MTNVLYPNTFIGRFDKQDYRDDLTAFGNIRAPLMADAARSLVNPIWSANQQEIKSKNAFEMFGSTEDYLRGLSGEVPHFIQMQQAKGALPEPYVDPKVAQEDRNFLGNDIDNVPNFGELYAARRGSTNVTEHDLFGQIFQEQPSADFLQMKMNENARVYDFLAQSIY